MRTERLTILVTREQKRELASLAKQRRVSVGELVRTAVTAATRSTAAPAEDVGPSAEQIAALERAADDAMRALRRAADALDRADVEIARTRAHFDTKPGEVRDAESTPRALLQRALASVHGASV